MAGDTMYPPLRLRYAQDSLLERYMSHKELCGCERWVKTMTWEEITAHALARARRGPPHETHQDDPSTESEDEDSMNIDEEGSKRLDGATRLNSKIRAGSLDNWAQNDPRAHRKTQRRNDHPYSRMNRTGCARSTDDILLRGQHARYDHDDANDAQMQADPRIMAFPSAYLDVPLSSLQDVSTVTDLGRAQRSFSSGLRSPVREGSPVLCVDPSVIVEFPKPTQLPGGWISGGKIAPSKRLAEAQRMAKRKKAVMQLKAADKRKVAVVARARAEIKSVAQRDRLTRTTKATNANTTSSPSAAARTSHSTRATRSIATAMPTTAAHAAPRSTKSTRSTAPATATAAGSASPIRRSTRDRKETDPEKWSQSVAPGLNGMEVDTPLRASTRSARATTANGASSSTAAATSFNKNATSYSPQKTTATTELSPTVEATSSTQEGAVDGMVGVEFHPAHAPVDSVVDVERHVINRATADMATTPPTAGLDTSASTPSALQHLLMTEGRWDQQPATAEAMREEPTRTHAESNAVAESGSAPTQLTIQQLIIHNAPVYVTQPLTLPPTSHRPHQFTTRPMPGSPFSSECGPSGPLGSIPGHGMYPPPVGPYLAYAQPHHIYPQAHPYFHHGYPQPSPPNPPLPSGYVKGGHLVDIPVTVAAVATSVPKKKPRRSYTTRSPAPSTVAAPPQVEASAACQVSPAVQDGDMDQFIWCGRIDDTATFIESVGEYMYLRCKCLIPRTKEGIMKHYIEGHGIQLEEPGQKCSWGSSCKVRGWGKNLATHVYDMHVVGEKRLCEGKGCKLEQVPRTKFCKSSACARVEPLWANGEVTL